MHWTKLRFAGRTNVDLPIVGAAPTDQFILKGVDGLGPPEIDVVISNTLHEGGIFQNKRPQNKEIVARVGLNPNWAGGETPSDLRTYMYGLLSGGYSGDKISVEVMDVDDVVCLAEGYVKKFEIAPFSKDPEVQITVGCLSPYLSAPDDTHVPLGALDKDAPVILNEGTVRTGFKLSMVMASPVGNMYIVADGGQEAFRVNYDFHVGDIYEFNTEPGERYVHVIRGGNTINLMSKLTSNSSWINLHPGVNTLDTDATGFDWNDVSYRAKYWGV